jgi:hypothetical protein
MLCRRRAMERVDMLTDHGSERRLCLAFGFKFNPSLQIFVAARRVSSSFAATSSRNFPHTRNRNRSSVLSSGGDIGVKVTKERNHMVQVVYKTLYSSTQDSSQTLGDLTRRRTGDRRTGYGSAGTRAGTLGVEFEATGCSLVPTCCRGPVTR